MTLRGLILPSVSLVVMLLLIITSGKEEEEEDEEDKSPFTKQINYHQYIILLTCNLNEEKHHHLREDDDKEEHVCVCVGGEGAERGGEGRFIYIILYIQFQTGNVPPKLFEISGLKRVQIFGHVFLLIQKRSLFIQLIHFFEIFIIWGMFLYLFLFVFFF